MAPLAYVLCASDDVTKITPFLRQARGLAAKWGLRLWDRGLCQPGEDPDAQARDAAAVASVLLVMVSPSLDQEALDADPAWPTLLRRQRRHELRVIPILLRPCLFEETPFGHLEPLPQRRTPVLSWEDKDEAWLTVLRELHGALTGARPAPPDEQRVVVQSIGVLLDRKPQWAAFEAHCRDHRHTLTLVAGPPQQSGLPFFVERIRHHLPEQEELLRVELQDVWEKMPATGWEQWGNALRRTLALRLRRSGGTLPELLKAATDAQGLLLFLSPRPLEAHRLTPERRAGLQALITTLLPQAIQDAAPRHPVRAILPLHGRAGEESGLWAFGQACLQAAPPLQAQAIAVAAMPTWDEVRAFIEERGPALAAEQEQEIAAFYHKLLTSEIPSFSALVELLERYL